MDERPTKRRTSRGICYLCEGEFGKNAMTRHLEKCREEIAAENSPLKSGGAKARFFHLRVEGRDLPFYWLHLDIRADATLSDLDDFLRHVWLECCGHLSAFTIEDVRYRWEPPGGFGGDDFFDRMDAVFGMPKEETLDITLAETLSPGMTFFHEYDFGSTTDLKLRVLGEREAPTREKNIQILARNKAPEIACDICENPAVWVGYSERAEEMRALCMECAEKEEGYEDLALPLVNSPRTGVCGYTGVAEY